MAAVELRSILSSSNMYLLEAAKSAFAWTSELNNAS